MAIDENKLIEDLIPILQCLDNMFIVGRIIGVIDSQPKLDVPDTNVGKWIPCSERLPKESGKYLVTLKGGAVETDSFSKVDNKWVYFNTQIAWFSRELPDPYKGE